jgi:hypothetical protein
VAPKPHHRPQIQVDRAKVHWQSPSWAALFKTKRYPRWLCKWCAYRRSQVSNAYPQSLNLMLCGGCIYPFFAASGRNYEAMRVCFDSITDSLVAEHQVNSAGRCSNWDRLQYARYGAVPHFQSWLHVNRSVPGWGRAIVEANSAFHRCRAG